MLRASLALPVRLWVEGGPLSRRFRGALIGSGGMDASEPGLLDLPGRRGGLLLSGSCAKGNRERARPPEVTIAHQPVPSTLRHWGVGQVLHIAVAGRRRVPGEAQA